MGGTYRIQEMTTTPDFLVFFIVYSLVNGLVFFFYAHDKHKAKRNGQGELQKTGYCFLPSSHLLEPLRDAGVPYPRPGK